MPDLEPYSENSELEALLNSKAAASVLSVLLSSIPTGVIIVGAPDGKMLRVSEFMARLVGRSGREMEGHLISDIERIPKSHLAAAIGLALVENGWRVLFTRTTDLVQRLQVARRELALEAAINRLDRFDLLILDDLAYVSKDQAETSVLFELISARYERRSILITANQPFGEWGKVFPDPAMTLAAIDRLVHHSTIFEMNVDSYRRRIAINRQRGPGRPPSRATPKTLEQHTD